MSMQQHGIFTMSCTPLVCHLLTNLELVFSHSDLNRSSSLRCLKSKRGSAQDRSHEPVRSNPHND